MKSREDSGGFSGHKNFWLSPFSLPKKKRKEETKFTETSLLEHSIKHGVHVIIIGFNPTQVIHSSSFRLASYQGKRDLSTRSLKFSDFQNSNFFFVKLLLER